MNERSDAESNSENLGWYYFSTWNGLRVERGGILSITSFDLCAGVSRYVHSTTTITIHNWYCCSCSCRCSGDSFIIVIFIYIYWNGIL